MYVNVDKKLQQSIYKLKYVDKNTSSELDKFQDNVNNIKTEIGIINKIITTIYPQVDNIREKIKTLNFDNWVNEITSAAKTANVSRNKTSGIVHKTSS